MKEVSGENAAEKIFSVIKSLDIDSLPISEYNKDNLRRYKADTLFYKSVYLQLIGKALKKLTKPVNESTLADYGGGCGLLSFIAREMGFRHVIYNDIYDVSVSDAKELSVVFKSSPDVFCHGDIDVLVSEVSRLSLLPDLICSVNVLEHIYDLEAWFKSLNKLDGFSLVFLTGSNPRNPYVAYRHKAIHRISEYRGCERNIRKGNLFLSVSCLSERERIIREGYPDLAADKAALLARKTRGLRYEAILGAAAEYIERGAISYRMDHPTNTCDPYTGNWSERLIDIKGSLKMLSDLGMEGRFTGSYYCYSGNYALNVIKSLLNILLRITGSGFLFFSPMIALEIEKRLMTQSENK